LTVKHSPIFSLFSNFDEPHCGYYAFDFLKTIFIELTFG